MNTMRAGDGIHPVFRLKKPSKNINFEKNLDEEF
jgi:hypothetical protein